MHESRLCYRIGGSPHAIRDVNTLLRERPETAAAAMASALPKEITDRTEGMITGKIPRPSGYEPAFALQTYRWLADPHRCWTLRAIALTTGVYERTFYNWVKAHTDLQYAIEAGRAQQEVNFGSMLLHGFKYSSGVEYILTNLHGWTQKQRTEHAVDLNAAIAAQEHARKAQGTVWDEASAQKRDDTLLHNDGSHGQAEARGDDAEYKG